MNLLSLICFKAVSSNKVLFGVLLKMKEDFWLCHLSNGSRFDNGVWYPEAISLQKEQNMRVFITMNLGFIFSQVSEGGGGGGKVAWQQVQFC